MTEMDELARLKAEISHANEPSIKDWETITNDLIKSNEAHIRIEAYLMNRIAELEERVSKIEGWSL